MNNAWDWWFDEMLRQWLTVYYWPYWLAGNMDEMLSSGITLNGIKPICRP